MNQTIENVRCRDCNQVVFKTVKLFEIVKPGESYPTTMIGETEILPNASPKCTEGGEHRVDLCDLK